MKFQENAFLNFGTKQFFLPNSINASKGIREREGEEKKSGEIELDETKEQLP